MRTISSSKFFGAALPPDVRQVSDLPQAAPFFSGRSPSKIQSDCHIGRQSRFHGTRKFIERIILLTALLILLAATTRAAEPTYLYNAKFVQAAPGKLLELI